MTAIEWLKNLDLHTLPNQNSYGAMWANGENKKPKINNPTKKSDYKKFTDLSSKFPYVIEKLFTEFKYEYYLEIGVAYGGGLRLVYNVNPSAKIYGIDPMLDDKVLSHFNSRNGTGRGGYDGEIFTKPSVTLIRHSSTSAESINYCNKFLRGKINFLNIDGDHSFDVCLSDLNNYCDLISEDGLIWVDDVASHSGVGLAVKEFMKDNNSYNIWDWEGKGFELSDRGIDGVFLLRA